MNPQALLIPAIIINIAIVVMETVGFVMSIRKYGWSIFMNYTEDSNFIALVSGIIFIISAALALGTGTLVPSWVRMIRLIATTMLTVTFIVVITVLAPFDGKGGYRKFLCKGAMLFHHLLCPLVSLSGFLLFEGAPRLPQGTSFIVLIPTAVYGAVAITMNLRRKWDGPYPFLKVYKQPLYMSILWLFIILGSAWATGLGIWKLSEFIAG